MNEGLTILAIEDNRDDLGVLKTILAEAFPGARVLTCLSGLAGIEQALAEDPDIILLDTVMPGMDGFDVCRRLKAEERLRPIPVVFLTDLTTGREARIQALEAGAEAFLSKPIEEPELTAQIRAMAKIRAAGPSQHHERERLSALVMERTRALERELAERGKAEEALRESKTRLQAIFDSAGVAICVADPQGWWLQVNAAFEQMTGYSAEELYSLPLSLTHPDDMGALDDRRRDLQEGLRDSYRVEKRYVRKDGSILWMDLSVNAIRGEHRELLCIVVAGTDITERKRAEEALRRSESEARRLAREHASLARIGRIISSSLVLDEVFRQFAEEVNQILPHDRLLINLIRTGEAAYTELLHVSGIEVPGRGKGDSVPLPGTIAEHLTKTRQSLIIRLEDRESASQPFTGLIPAFEAGIRAILAVPLFSRDEVIGVFHIHSTLGEAYGDSHLKLAESIAGQIAGAIDNARLFSEHRRMSGALLDQQKRFQELFDEAPVGYHELDAEGRVVQVNRTELEMLGYSAEEMLGRFGWEFIVESEESRRAYLEKVSGIREIADLEFERTFLRKEGTPIPVVIRDRLLKNTQGRIIGMRSTIQDVTERKKAEKEMAALQEQFRQAQKMEAVGTLAGGVAHDFNNLLQAVLGYSEMLLSEKDEADPDYRALTEIKRVAQRGAELTRQLLTFSRKVQSQPKPLNLNQEVTAVEKLLRRTIPKMVRVELRLAGDLWTTVADPVQVGQVIMNLAVNAKDAMPDGGSLVIGTGNTTLDDGYCRDHVGSKPGRYVLLTVSDTGHGIEKEVLGHIFEPFFTTKGVGRGTGLGLAIVYGIVKGHGGFIECESEAGKGSVFKIYLPAADQEAAEIEHEDKGQPEGGTETLLLVDDEQSIRDLAAAILSKYGYKVLTASSGEEALKVYGGGKERIGLVVLDLIMPGMGGWKCLEGLRRIDPGAKVVIATGYAPEGRSKADFEGMATGYLNKPFDMREILREVRKALDKGKEKVGRG
jgi:PAS domain S-box-containing protein